MFPADTLWGISSQRDPAIKTSIRGLPYIREERVGALDVEETHAVW